MEPPRGFTDPGHYKDVIDLLDHSHVIWRPYERRRDITPIQDRCWYSGWIMADKNRRVRHFPEWVLREYWYVRLFPGLLQTLGVLWQGRWLWPLWSLLYMSSANRRGVIWFWITSHGAILGGTWDGYVVYHILLWTPLRPFLTTQLMPIIVLSLPTRRLLLSSSGSDILPTHTRSSAISEPKWTVQWGILMCFVI